MISASPSLVFTDTILSIIVLSDTNGLSTLFFGSFFALHRHWVPMNFCPFPSTSVAILNFFLVNLFQVARATFEMKGKKWY